LRITPLLFLGCWTSHLDHDIRGIPFSPSRSQHFLVISNETVEVSFPPLKRGSFGEYRSSSLIGLSIPSSLFVRRPAHRDLLSLLHSVCSFPFPVASQFQTGEPALFTMASAFSFMGF